MLIVFGGLPGTGKTTISRILAGRRAAVYVRIDTIEQALRSAAVLAGDVGAAGYIIGNALAASNLANRQTVIVDCVNPVPESRQGWQATATRANISLIEVEVICSDTSEHRRRVETRTSDVEGLSSPSWQSVVERLYIPWLEPHLVIDTARLTPEEAVELIEQRIDAARQLS
jgi:predicted kinase